MTAKVMMKIKKGGAVTENEEPQAYLTYKGLGVTPMVAGVPLFVALALVGGVALAMVTFIAGLPLFGIFIIISDITCYLFFKVLCENNNKAPEVLKLKIIGFIAVLKHGKIIKADSGVENQHAKREKFQREFKDLFKP